MHERLQRELDMIAGYAAKLYAVDNEAVLAEMDSIMCEETPDEYVLRDLREGLPAKDHTPVTQLIRALARIADSAADRLALLRKDEEVEA